eukprot:8304487-Lingulodinium_polyedra.AAC.1
MQHNALLCVAVHCTAALPWSRMRCSALHCSGMLWNATHCSAFHCSTAMQHNALICTAQQHCHAAQCTAL